MIKLRSAFGVILAISSSSALADEAKCAAIDVPKHIISARGGRWVELAPEQWQFLRGVYAANPSTPLSLPVGGRAPRTRASWRPHEAGDKWNAAMAETANPRDVLDTIKQARDQTSGTNPLARP